MPSTALLIDDDINGMTLFGYALRTHGFEVLTAGDRACGRLDRHERRR